MKYQLSRQTDKRLRRLFVGCALSLGSLYPVGIQTTPPTIPPRYSIEAQPDQHLEWLEFHSSVGGCSMRFPSPPDHLSEQMHLPEEGFDLKYDAYISAGGPQTVFMLLIAQYPDFVNESYAKTSLEGFLNGFLNHNPGNQLLCADLSLVDGHEALDFFIRAKGIYFKGRALMIKNSLYLMAMECDILCYDDAQYNAFITSFRKTTSP